jgi:predicted nucleic acid-binding protein
LERGPGCDAFRTGPGVILVDTTAWIDWFADRDCPATERLHLAIEQGEDLAVCGVVVTEVLQGVHNDRDFLTIRDRLFGLIYLPMSRRTHVRAAEMYRGCRKRGLTIRKPVDCIIAATCIENSAFILHHDRDFDHLAKHYPLQCW